MMDGQIVETSKAMLARHRVAIEGLTWDEAGVIEAARQVLLGVWPERGADDDYLSEFTEGVLHSDSVAYGLAAIRRAGTVVEAREAFECPCANPLHHSAKPQYVHPSAGPDAWPQLLCSAYGIAEVAALRLRSYDRDMKDPETRLPKSFITEYNRHLSAMEGGF